MWQIIQVELRDGETYCPANAGSGSHRLGKLCSSKVLRCSCFAAAVCNPGPSFLSDCVDDNPMGHNHKQTGWIDSFGDGCVDYSENPSWCSHADHHKEKGIVARLPTPISSHHHPNSFMSCSSLSIFFIMTHLRTSSFCLLSRWAERLAGVLRVWRWQQLSRGESLSPRHHSFEQ